MDKTTLLDSIHEEFKRVFVERAGSLTKLEEAINVKADPGRLVPQSSSKLVRIYPSSCVPIEVSLKIQRSGVIPFVRPKHPPTKVAEAIRQGRVQTKNAMHNIPGCIPEFRAAMESDLWMCMFVDARHRELTDAGGMRNPGETIEATAARELYEESCGLFDFRDNPHARLSDGFVAVRGNTCVFFVDVTNTRFVAASGFPDDAPAKFAIAKSEMDVSRKEFFENSSMLWVPSSALKAGFASKTIQRVPAWMSTTGKVFPEGYPRVYEVVRRAIKPAFSNIESACRKES